MISCDRKIRPRKTPEPHAAEKEGFEPSNGFTRYTISSRAPSTKLGDFSTSLTCPSTSGSIA